MATHRRGRVYHARVTDTKVTVASLSSVLIDPERNLDQVRGACARAERDGARLLLCPELQLTGHGAHDLMAENAEPVPDGPMSRELLALSERHDLCLVVGLAELSGSVVGPATEGLQGVVANHVGTVLAVAPNGDVIHETQIDGLQDEIVTIPLSASAREFNRGPTRSRRWGTSLRILEQAFAYRRDRL